MFKFNKKKFKISSLTIRKEFHGDEDKIAMTINASATVPCDWLDYFDPTLKGKIFRPVEKDEQDMIDQAEDAPRLCMLALKGIKTPTLDLDYETDGYRCTISKGISGEADINLIQCKLSKFKFTPIEGGNITLKFNINTLPHQGTGIEISQCSMLLLDETVDLTLEPPSAEEMGLDQLVEDGA